MSYSQAGAEHVAVQRLPFQSLGANTAFSEWSGSSVKCFLDGMIRFAGGKLIHVDGPNRPTLLDAVFDSYRAKGERFLSELAGSFRIALWDPAEQKLMVAVDPFGTRAIYFSTANGVLFFAPKISCFSTVPSISKEIDPNAIFFYLNHSFIPAPFTAYRDIKRLEPGQYLCWQKGRITTGHYWDLQYEEDFALNEHKASQLVRSTVEQSVRSSMAALPYHRSEIGAFLSGGTDSSTLVGIMTQLGGEPVKTFSVGFSEQPYNEIEYARIAARRYQSDAYERFVSADEALAAVPVLAGQFDEPFGNSSAIPTYFCLRKGKEVGIKAMFAGDGGDELFGGNERYLTEKYFLPFDVMPDSVQSLTARLTAFLPAIYPLRKISRYVEQASLPNPKRFFRYQTFISDHVDEFLTDEFRAQVEHGFELRLPEYHYRRVSAAVPLNRLLYMDLKMCIADNDLFKVNQMAGAVGVNVCYPYLDRDLAELTGKIPASLKVKGFRKRYVFKKAFQELLPKEILRKKKHGFGMPTGEWLRHQQGFRDLARSLLLEPRAVQRGYFKRAGLERLLERHDRESSSYYGTYIWYFMMLELWHRHHVDRLSG